MTKNGFEKDYKKLERYYMQRLINVTRQARQAVVWQQVVGDGTTLPLDTVVQVSTGDQKNYKMQLENVMQLFYLNIDKNYSRTHCLFQTLLVDEKWLQSITDVTVGPE